MIKSLLLGLLFLQSHSFLFSQMGANVNRKNNEIDITDAIEKNYLELRISGVFDASYHESIDKDGMHFGKCMLAILKSKTDSFILLKFERGTILIPDNNNYQRMVVTKTCSLPLVPGRTIPTKFYAMCTNFHLLPPNEYSTYKVSQMGDSSILKLVNYFDSGYMQNMIAQHALWAVTDHVIFDSLVNYGADTNSILQSISVLNDLGINTPLQETFFRVGKGKPTLNAHRGVIIAISSGAVLAFIAGWFIIRRKRTNYIT